jgi:GT2 family glycosyltransferase
MSPSVLISYLHRDTVSHCFMQSLLDLQRHDKADRGAVAGLLPIFCPSGRLGPARNQQCAAMSKVDADWLWLVDSDMGFEPDALYRLMDAAHPQHRPVVGALNAVGFLGESDGRGGYATHALPGVYDSALQIMQRVPDNAVIKATGTGAACLLIHHSVLDRIANAIGPAWFTERDWPGSSDRLSEDLSFCTRLRDLGVPVYVHTGVRTTHHKYAWLMPGGEERS